MRDFPLPSTPASVASANGSLEHTFFFSSLPFPSRAPHPSISLENRVHYLAGKKQTPGDKGCTVIEKWIAEKLNELSV